VKDRIEASDAKCVVYFDNDFGGYVPKMRGAA
jgi:hypothetical protein